VFVAQLTSVFSWFGSSTAKGDSDGFVNVPVWVVKAPPILIVAVILGSVVSMVVAERPGSGEGWLDAGTFKAVVTFCVTVLNATTVFIVIRVFGNLPAQS
jgi:hypothetical protein